MHSPDPRPAPPIPVRCQVDSADIDAMNYWLNEAPMTDPASCNGIVFAVRRLVRPDLAVRLEENQGDTLGVRVGQDLISLPPDWSTWWRHARQGRQVLPLSATLIVPRDLLPASSLLPSPPLRGRRRALRLDPAPGLAPLSRN